MTPILVFDMKTVPDGVALRKINARAHRSAMPSGATGFRSGGARRPQRFSALHLHRFVGISLRPARPRTAPCLVTGGGRGAGKRFGAAFFDGVESTLLSSYRGTAADSTCRL